MLLVGWRIDVNVREDLVHCYTDLYAGNLGSPKEFPMLIDFEFFIPANRLQNIALGNEAVTNEGTLGNVADASILTAGNVKYSTRRSEQPWSSVCMRTMWLLAECCQQIEATRFELPDEIIQSRLRADHVIIIREDHHSRLCRFHESIATSR